MAETLTDKLKLIKRDTGDLNWGEGANANLDVIDKHIQQAFLRPPRTVTVTLGSGGVGANLVGNTTYFFKVTAYNAAGETTEGLVPAVVEGQVVEPATPLPIIIQWEVVKGAAGYKIYKSTATGQEKFLASVSGESTVTYTDSGNVAVDTGISVPTDNSAKTSVSKIVAGTNLTISPVDGLGEVTINSTTPPPADASDIVKGISKLSVAPAVADNPIAVGDNDARNTNARTPLAHALGGAEHNADTVANLNAKLSDGPIPKSSEAVLHTLADVKGDLVVASGANAFSRLAAGADGKVLQANGAAALGVEWGDVAGGNWRLVSELFNTVYGETFTPEFTGLALQMHRSYLLVFDLKVTNLAATPGWIALRVNGLSTTAYPQFWMITDQLSGTQTDDGATGYFIKLLNIYETSGSVIEVSGYLIISDRPAALGYPHANGIYSASCGNLHRGNIAIRMNLNGVDLTSLGLVGSTDMKFVLGNTSRLALYQAQ